MDDSVSRAKGRQRGWRRPRVPSPPPKLMLAHSLSAEEANLQLASPLFSHPAEIRNYIFQLAMISSDIEERPFDERSHYHRPGYRAHQRIHIDLLLTCRLVYLETYLLPVSENEHVFWCHRPPPGVRNASDPRAYFQRMSAEQRAAVRDVHFFLQQYWLEDIQFPHICRSLADMEVGDTKKGWKLRMTLRHGDWWYWERDEAMGIDPYRVGRTTWDMMLSNMSKKTRVFENEFREEPENTGLNRRADRDVVHGWGWQFRVLKGLEELEVEFETADKPERKKQLETIIKYAKTWEFKLHDGKELTAKDCKESRLKWQGLINYSEGDSDAVWQTANFEGAVVRWRV